MSKQFDIDEVLHFAAGHGFTDLCKLALKDGANVNRWDTIALRDACYNGHLEVVKVLLDAGSKMHAYGDMALGWARHNGHTEVVKLLLSHTVSK